MRARSFHPGAARQHIERNTAAGHGRAMPGAGQRLAQPADQEAAHRAAVAEADLGFRGMDVHVDLARVEIDEQRQERLPPLGQHVAIRRAHGADKKAIAHGPAVDEQELHRGVLPVQRRQACEARDRNAFAAAVELDRVGHELAAHDAPEAFEPASAVVAAGRQPDARALARDERESDRRPGHRDALENIRNRAILGGLRLHELEARGRRREQLAHLDAGAAIVGGGLEVALGAAVDCDRERLE